METWILNLVVFVALKAHPRPTLERHLSPLNARGKVLPSGHATSLPRPLGRFQRFALGLGAAGLATLAACAGLGERAEPSGYAQDRPPACAGSPELMIAETTAPQAAGQPAGLMVTRPAWALPRPKPPGAQAAASITEVRGAFVYPPTRRSAQFIDGQAVDFGATDSGVTVYLTLMHDLIATDAATGAVLWKAQSSFFYDSLRFIDRTLDGAPRRVVRLEQSGSTARDLWAHFDLATGAELPNPDARPLPAGTLTPLTHWYGANANPGQSMRRLVTTEAEWRALHAQFFQTNESALPGTPPLDLGGIDWTAEAVYLTYTGEPSQCRGVGLHSAFVNGERVLLRQSEYTYQTAALDGEDEPAAPIERPWGVFRVPRLGAGGELIVELNRQGLILGPPMWTELVRFDFE